MSKIECWAVEFRHGGSEWALNEVFLSRRIAEATAEDCREEVWSRECPEYRVRRYVPES